MSDQKRIGDGGPKGRIKTRAEASDLRADGDVLTAILGQVRLGQCIAFTGMECVVIGLFNAFDKRQSAVLGDDVFHGNLLGQIVG